MQDMVIVSNSNKSAEEVIKWMEDTVIVSVNKRHAQFHNFADTRLINNKYWTNWVQFNFHYLWKQKWKLTKKNKYKIIAAGFYLPPFWFKNASMRGFKLMYKL